MPTLTPAEFAKLDAKTIQFGLPATGIHKTDAKGKVETKDWIFLNLKRPLDFLLGKGKAWVNNTDRFANNAPLPSDRTNLSVLLVEDPEHPTDQERQTVQAFERIMRGAVDFVDSQPSLSTGWAKQGWNKPALVEARMNARALYYGEKDATDLVPNKSPTVEIRFSVNKKTKEVLTPIQKVSADDSSSGGTMTPFLHADLMDLKTVDVAGIVSLESVMVGPKNKCVYLRFVFKEMCIWVPKSREEREAEDRVYSSYLLEQMVRSEYIQVAPPLAAQAGKRKSAADETPCDAPSPKRAAREEAVQEGGPGDEVEEEGDEGEEEGDEGEEEGDEGEEEEEDAAAGVNQPI